MSSTMNSVEDIERFIERQSAELEALKADLGRLKGQGPNGAPVTVRASEAFRGITFRRWTVPGLIHETGIGFLACEPFGGKTYVAIQMAGCIATGRRIFGDFAPIEPVPVLYLYGESDRDGFLSDMRRCFEGLGLQDPRVYVNAVGVKNSTLKIGELGLDAAIEQTGAKVIVFDTLSFFSSAKENDNDEVQRKLMEPAVELSRKHRCFLLFIHHEQKGAGETKGVYRMRGASVLSGVADVIMRIEKADAEDQENRFRILHVDKVRGARGGKFELELDFGRRCFWRKGQDPAEILWRAR